jgi:hypothetical protein
MLSVPYTQIVRVVLSPASGSDGRAAYGPPPVTP